jgi:hypothetical protein
LLKGLENKMAKHFLQIALMIGIFFAPVCVFAEPPTEPNIDLMISWEPLSDRTMVLNYEGLSFRHNIIDHKAINHCKEISVNKDGTTTLLTHIGNNAYEYILITAPEFYRIGTDDWEWIGIRTNEKYAGW